MPLFLFPLHIEKLQYLHGQLVFPEICTLTTSFSTRNQLRPFHSHEFYDFVQKGLVTGYQRVSLASVQFERNRISKLGQPVRSESGQDEAGRGAGRVGLDSSAGTDLVRTLYVRWCDNLIRML
ncbi:hypothetical protein Trydic_g23218 [Trypoxylus dichotomus]